MPLIIISRDPDSRRSSASGKLSRADQLSLMFTRLGRAGAGAGPGGVDDGGGKAVKGSTFVMQFEVKRVAEALLQSKTFEGKGNPEGSEPACTQCVVIASASQLCSQYEHEGSFHGVSMRAVLTVSACLHRPWSSIKTAVSHFLF